HCLYNDKLVYSSCNADHRYLRSFPTRRSSDLTKFGGEGIIKYIYYFILITHIILAAVILPFILYTSYRALIGEYPKHKKLAKIRSEEHTSELQSRENLVCRLLLEKKKKRRHPN